jgi:hypothetical protein
MREPWMELKIGDLIRFVHMPTGFSRRNCHCDTLRVYKRLIERRRPVRVAYFREWGEFKTPWIRCQFRRKDGRIDYHSLMINHDGWVRVIPRKRARKT